MENSRVSKPRLSQIAADFIWKNYASTLSIAFQRSLSNEQEQDHLTGGDQSI